MSISSKIIFGIAIIAASMLQISCSGNSDKKTVITFWAMGAEGESVQKLLPQFEKENPGIRVKVQMIPWTAAQEKLITAYASDNMPDVWQLGNTWIPQFSALNALEDLNTWTAKCSTVKKDNYFEGIWNTNVMNGQVYGIPWYVDTRVMFYRKDVFSRAGYDRPPKSWAELYDLSRRIRKNAGGGEKYAIYLPTNEWAPFVIFALQNGSTLLRNNDSYGNFSAPEFKEAFRYAVRFLQEGLAPIGISQVTNVYQAFAEEYFSIYISGPWNVVEFRKWMKNGLKDKWAIAPLPSVDGRNPGLSLAGGASLVMSRKSEHKKEAWKFIEYLSRPDVQLRFYNLLYDLPAVKIAWQDPSLLHDEYMSKFYEQLQYVTPTPKIPEWEQIAFAKIQQYAELAARNSMSIDQAAAALDKDVNQILEKRRWLLSRK